MIVGRVSQRRVATRVIARKGMAHLLLRRRDAGWKRARYPGRVGMMQRRQKSLVWRWLRRGHASLDKGRKILSPRIKRRNARRDRDSITYTREKTPTMAGNHHSRPKSTATHTYRWQKTQDRVTTTWSWLIKLNPSSSNVHKKSNGAYQTKFYKSLTPPNPTRSQALAATNTNTPPSSHFTKESRYLGISCSVKRIGSIMTLTSFRYKTIKKTRLMCVRTIWNQRSTNSKGWLSGRVLCPRVRGWCLVGRRNWGQVLSPPKLRIGRISILI